MRSQRCEMVPARFFLNWKRVGVGLRTEEIRMKLCTTWHLLSANLKLLMLR